MGNKVFFELLQVALGTKEALSVAPSPEEWRTIFAMAQKQTLVGVCFSGIECLPAAQRPPQDVLLQWWGLTRQIEERNRVMDERTEETTRYFRSHGFKTAILKGQGMARLYGSPLPTSLKGKDNGWKLGLRRQSGDVDVWLVPEEENGEKRKEKKRSTREAIYRFAREHDVEGKLHGVNYHHVHYELFDDTEVEVHIYPCYLHNPFANERLHRFFEAYPPTDDSDTPSLTFNLVFVLLHIYNHFIGHGVGLRQLMDYYFLLRQQKENGKCEMSNGKRKDKDENGETQKVKGKGEKMGDEKMEAVEWLKRLKVMRFAAATMWVLQEVFGLEDEYLLVEPNEKEGRFLLEEICQTGNMGHYDERHWGSLNTPMSRFFYNLRRDWHFLAHYPQEVCWQPLFSVWMNVRRHFLLRRMGNG